MTYYPVNPLTGDPTYRILGLPESELYIPSIESGLVTVNGFVLQDVAATVYSDSDLWKNVAARSRLQHPAEFDVGDDMVLPSSKDL